VTRSCKFPQKRGDLPGAYPDSVESKDGFGKFQGGPFPVVDGNRLPVHGRLEAPPTGL